jgi:hypothetical protein
MKTKDDDKQNPDIVQDPKEPCFVSITLTLVMFWIRLLIFIFHAFIKLMWILIRRGKIILKFDKRKKCTKIVQLGCPLVGKRHSWSRKLHKGGLNFNTAVILFANLSHVLILVYLFTVTQPRPDLIFCRSGSL